LLAPKAEFNHLVYKNILGINNMKTQTARLELSLGRQALAKADFKDNMAFAALLDGAVISDN
jgi:hypothetical protein